MYFDKYGLYHLTENPSPEGSENGPLFTAYYYALLNKLTGDVYSTSSIPVVIYNIYDGTRFKASVETTNLHFSHDNMTGLYALYALAKKKPNLPTVYWNGSWNLHPRDVIFYNYAKGKLWAKLLLFIPSIAMIVSCLQQYKYRNGQRFVKTDGKLLAWLRCNTYNMPITLKICTWCLKHFGYFKETGWLGVFNTYFVDKNHPINIMAKRLYENV